VQKGKHLFVGHVGSSRQLGNPWHALPPVFFRNVMNWWDLRFGLAQCYDLEGDILIFARGEAGLGVELGKNGARGDRVGAGTSMLASVYHMYTSLVH
jgi:hypothetical protein